MTLTRRWTELTAAVGSPSQVARKLRGAFRTTVNLFSRREREERIVHTVPFSSDEAQAMAKARYRAVSRRFVTGRALAEATAQQMDYRWIEDAAAA